MKISLNEIKKYVAIPEDVSTDDLIKLIGSRLVEVEEAIDLAPKYQNAYIVKVVDCEPIPDTHLHLCQIDVGGAMGEGSSAEPSLAEGPELRRGVAARPRNDGRRERASASEAFRGATRSLVQVVCGAPNVRKGMLAVWLAPGAIVPQTFGEENFKLGVRKLRGYESNGMLAGLDELDLGDDHSGIVEIDPSMDFPGENRNVKPGDSFAEAFELNDIILDIENKSLTHRPDAFGLIGFAREVAGILDLPFTGGLGDDGSANARARDFAPTFRASFPEAFEKVNMSEANLTFSETQAAEKSERNLGARSEIEIKIKDPSLCPRYSCAIISMKNPTEKDKYLTPDAVFLAKAGMRAISKIVDVTNILMLKTGQPLHAFDYDKFLAVGGTKSPKVVVRAAKAGETLKLLDGKTIECTPDDIIITSNNIPVALAGAMGGASTEIDADTTTVFLESATFSLYNLRKTQMSHGIFSEAITRFTKGQPAGQTVPALNAAVALLGGTLLASADAYPAPQPAEVIPVTAADVNNLLGANYTISDIKKTLSNVGIIDFKIPFWRTDLHIKEDIIEEVGRLKGFDNIPRTFPSRPFVGAAPDPLLKLKREIRGILSDSLGAHEVLTYTFVNKKLQQTVGEDPRDSYEIVNSISPDLQVLRQTLTPSLLEKVYTNQKSGYKNFALYEMNQVTKKSYGLTPDKVPNVHHHLSLVTTADYYAAKSLLEALAKKLNLGQPEIAPFDEKTGPAFFEPLHSAEITINGEKIGHVGEIRAGITKALKLTGTMSAFELNLERVLELAKTTAKKPQALSKYPSVDRDLTFKVPAETPYAELTEKIEQSLENSEHIIYNLTPASIFQKEPKTKNISYKLTFASTKKTLASDEISEIVNKIVNETAALGATII